MRVAAACAGRALLYCISAWFRLIKPGKRAGRVESTRSNCSLKSPVAFTASFWTSSKWLLIPSKFQQTIHMMIFWVKRFCLSACTIGRAKCLIHTFYLSALRQANNCSLPVTAIRRFQKGLFLRFSNSLVHVSSTRRCCCWSKVNSWETSRRQRLFAKPNLLR